MPKEASTRVNRIVVLDDGIVFVEMFGEVTFGRSDAEATLAAINELTGSRPALHCVDVRKARSMDRASREVFANGAHTRAAALVVSNPLSRVIGNFFLGLSKAKFPLRLFSDVDSAIAWLHTL